MVACRGVTVVNWLFVFLIHYTVVSISRVKFIYRDPAVPCPALGGSHPANPAKGLLWACRDEPGEHRRTVITTCSVFIYLFIPGLMNLSTTQVEQY